MALALQVTVDFAEGAQVAQREITSVGQHRIEAGTGMRLAEDEAVSIREVGVLRIVAKHFVIQSGQNIGLGKGPA